MRIQSSSEASPKDHSTSPAPEAEQKEVSDSVTTNLLLEALQVSHTEILVILEQLARGWNHVRIPACITADAD